MSNKKDKLRLLRKKVVSNKNNSKKLEEFLVKFADLASGEKLFQLCLSLVKTHAEIAICYIARSANESKNAKVWLEKRKKNNLYIQEMMEVWMLDYKGV